MTDDDLPDLHDVQTTFDKQVVEGLETTTTPLELLASLDERAFAGLPAKSEDDSASPYPLDAWARFFLFRGISGIAVDALIDRLENNHGEAAMLGFDTVPEGHDSPVPDQSTASRVVKRAAPIEPGDLARLGPEDCEWLRRKRDRILELVHERGNPMGLRALEPEDKQDASPSAKHRHRRDQRNEAGHALASTIANILSFNRASNSKYAIEMYLHPMAEMCTATKTAREAFRLDDDPVEGINRKPKGETFRAHVNDLNPGDIVEMADTVAELLVKKMKHHPKFDRPVEAAIDKVSVEIPGKPENTDEAVENLGEMFREVDEDKMGQFVKTDLKDYDVEDGEEEYVKVYEFITLNIVGQHFRVPLVVRPDPEEVSTATLVRELYWRAQEMVSIDVLYLDAGFFSADCLQSLNETSSDYVMSAPKDGDRLGPWVEDIDAEVAVKRDHAVFGPVKGKGRAYVHTNIVAKPSIRDPDSTVLFATNKDVKDEIGIDRRWASKEMDKYSRRGHQEKSYEMLKRFIAPTESKSFRIHLFYFVFAALAYSMWKLVDFQTKKDLGIDPDADSVVEFSEFFNTVRGFLKRQALAPPPG
jgi:hypothetical protein